MEFNKTQPLKNPALVSAMRDIKQQHSKDNEIKFLEELKKAHFISPAIIEVKDENGNFVKTEDRPEDPENTRINFMMLAVKDGKRFLPAFTDVDELRKWRKEQKVQTVVTTFDQYLAMILGDPDGPSGFVINPFGENIIMHRELLEQLREAQKTNEKVMIGDPKDFPQDMADALSGFFSGEEAVDRAYLQMMKRGNTITYLIVVDYDTQAADKKVLFDSIARTVKPYLHDGLGLSVASYSDSFGSRVAANKQPFYTR
ncbi:MAG: enhanced serine sensitivity protein SseB C-terminal domain-containing protein [Oscillospiraceae bacterium]|nr:enhanced serine sensitivity protein SseB C-terminal domain-containing protein [Oscillospiraceae bacterium]